MSFLSDAFHRRFQDTLPVKLQDESYQGSFWDIFGLAQASCNQQCCCTHEHELPSSIVPAPGSESPVLLNAGIIAVAQVKERTFSLPLDDPSPDASLRSPSMLSFHSPLSRELPIEGEVLGRREHCETHAPAPAEDPNITKGQLQKVMADFLRQSWKGTRCIHIDEKTGERHSAHYYLDKQLTYLLIAVGDASVPHVRCPTGTIADVLTIDDGVELFPKKVLSLCTLPERDMLLMVQMNVDHSGGAPSRLFLIVESVLGKNTFSECMRVLATYAQSTPRADLQTRHAPRAGVPHPGLE